MKKLSLALAGLLSASVGVAHADYMYNNAWTVNLEGGYGEVFTPDTNLNSMGGSHKTSDIMYSTGFGYSWALQRGLFAGLEADYLNNGTAKYSGSGAPNDTGSLNINSSAYAAMINLTYYIGNSWNWFGKFGYAYVQNENKYDGTVTADGSGGNSYTLNNNYTSHSWQPMAVFGIGYAVPLSNGIGLNIYSDVTWINGQNSGNFGYISSNNYEANGQTAEVLAAKVGLQMYF